MVDRLDVDKLLGIIGERRFEPMPFCTHGGKFFYFFFEETPYYAEWINYWLTLYRAVGDNRVVGLKLTQDVSGV